MKKVRISIDLEEDEYASFASEASRRGLTVETLLERTVLGLLREMEQEEKDGTDRPIFLP